MSNAEFLGISCHLKTSHKLYVWLSADDESYFPLRTRIDLSPKYVKAPFLSMLQTP